MGRVDAAANALRAHEADPSRAGAFGFDRCATRDAYGVVSGKQRTTLRATNGEARF